MNYCDCDDWDWLWRVLETRVMTVIKSWTRVEGRVDGSNRGSGFVIVLGVV